MSSHLRWQYLTTVTTVHSVRFYMGHYGAKSPKPTVLYSNRAELLQQFATGKPATTERLCKKYVDHAGKKRVVGKTQLKSSQKYAKEFGFKISANYRRYRDLINQQYPSLEDQVSCLGCKAERMTHFRNEPSVLVAGCFQLNIAQDCITPAPWDVVCALVQVDDDWPDAELDSCLGYLRTKRTHRSLEDVL